MKSTLYETYSNPLLKDYIRKQEVSKLALAVIWKKDNKKENNIMDWHLPA